MDNIELTVAFDWLPEEVRVGTLSSERVRGTATYHFAYDADWLARFRKIVLSKDLPAVSGLQYKKETVFDMLQDCLPDRWGRRLIDKRERLLAEKENRLPRRLCDDDYLLMLDDATRMGAFRLRHGESYMGVDDADCPVPPIANIREFTDLAHRFEKAEAEGESMHEQWLRNLYKQGSSLGGARPKANVRDTDGTLYIAKIPSIHDDYDVALWEHFACSLAREAGIKVAETRLLTLEGQRHHTLLSKRFDRKGTQRVHFASAMTLCGLKDGASADTGNGYLDIVDMIIGHSGMANTYASLKELYRRVAFNCLIGNHDDHFRNHGFLLTQNGWEWSPAYDLNPTNEITQSLLITARSNDSSIEQLLEASSDYMLESAEAAAIVEEVKNAVKNWQKVATRCGISSVEQGRFARRLDWMIK